MARHRSPPNVWIKILAYVLTLTVVGVGTWVGLSQTVGRVHLNPKASVSAPAHHPRPHTSKPPAKPTEHSKPVQRQATHLVKPGDTLWAIAVHHFGHGQEWHRLYDMNKQIGPNPGLIRPGEVLRL
jgi:hypothetical protein